MAIPGARSIDTLFEKVKEKDIVIVPDNDLAEALRARVRDPQTGRWAYTPYQYVIEHGPPSLLDIDAIIETLEEELDHDRDVIEDAVHQLTGYWQHTRKRPGPEDISGIDNELIAAFRTLSEHETTVVQAIAETNIDGDIAVIDPYRMTPLERQLTEGATVVRTVTDETADLGPWYIFDNRAMIATAATDIIEHYGTHNVGIIVDTGSQHDAVLRAHCRANDIPIENDTASVPDPLRRAIQILQKATDWQQLQVGEIIYQLPADYRLEDTDYHKALIDIDTAQANRVKNLLATLSEMTIYDAFTELERKGLDIPDGLYRLIKDHRYTDKPVSDTTLTAMRELVQSHDWAENTDGLRVVEPGTSTHIDRPVIICIGMDERWTQQPMEPWHDAEHLNEALQKTVQASIQSGERQYYFVEDQRGDRPIAPMHGIGDGQIERFTDLPHTIIADSTDRSEPFMVARNQETRKRPQTISQSDLNTLVRCPRDYLMGSLIDERDRIWFRRGSLFHEFAEYYTSHSGDVNERGIEPFIEHIIDELKPFLTAEQIPLKRTEIRLGLERIMEYIDEQHTEPIYFSDYTDMEWSTNEFAALFGNPITSDRTERYFSEPSIGISGVVDYLPRPTQLVDYKSSTQKSARDVVTSANIDLFEDEPTFQVIMYLTYHRTEVPDERLSFTFFHFLENLDDRLAGDDDLESITTTIEYHPASFTKALANEELFETLIGDVAESNKRRKTLEGIGRERFRSFLQEHPLPDHYDPSIIEDSPFHEALLDLAIKEVGDYKYVRTACQQIIKRITAIRKQRLFEDDLDQFESFIETWLEHLHTWNTERFPVGDPDLDTIDNRDLILTGDH